ncbi:hypothetical protein D3C81_1763720 [compost metagenome]
MQVVPDALQALPARLQVLVGKTQVKAAGLPEAHVDAGFFAQRIAQLRPQARGAHGPARVGGHAEALALHPDQPEVAARGPEGIVALVKHSHPRAVAGRAVGDGGADQAAANHDEIGCRHVS